MNDRHNKQEHRYQLIVDQGHYRAYVLRCWAEETADELVWRFSLEGKDRLRRGFATVDSLSQFMQAEFQNYSIDR